MSVRNERGEGAIKTVIVVAVVLYAVFVAIKPTTNTTDVNICCFTASTLASIGKCANAIE